MRKFSILFHNFLIFDLILMKLAPKWPEFCKEYPGIGDFCVPWGGGTACTLGAPLLATGLHGFHQCPPAALAINDNCQVVHNTKTPVLL